MTIEYTEGPHKTLRFCISIMTPLVDDKLMIRQHFQPYNIIVGAGGIVVDRPDRDSLQCKESEQESKMEKIQWLVGLLKQICHIILNRVMILKCTANTWRKIFFISIQYSAQTRFKVWQQIEF